MSSPFKSPFTRRQFIGSLAAWLACPGRASSQSLEQQVRFGVFSLFEPRMLVLKADEPLLLLLEGQPSFVAPPATPIRISLEERGQITMVIGTHSFTASIVHAAAGSGGNADFLLSVPASSAHGPIQPTYHGALEVFAAASSLQPIIFIDRETAVASIVEAESPPDAPPSYRMAQAIATRSFLVAARHCHPRFDFCDTTHCQFLRGPASVDSPAYTAALRTQSLHIRFEGHSIAAMYSRSCSGRTNSLAELGLRTNDYPYYPVPCAFCLHNPERWERSLEQSAIPGITTGVPTSGFLRHDERGRLAFNHVHGWSAIPSDTFTSVNQQLVGRGIGHGLGLCQSGAAAMAKKGAGFDEILAHYYPNTSIAAN